MSDSPTLRPARISAFGASHTKPPPMSSGGFPGDEELLADDLFGPLDDQPEMADDGDDGMLAGFHSKSSSSMSSSSSGMTHSSSLSAFPDFSGDPASAAHMVRSKDEQGALEQHRRTLSLTSAAHLSHCIHHLLAAHGVHDSWYSTLHGLIQTAVERVRPDTRRGDLMDIRHYVKVQTIPGGKKSDCAYVDGLVFQHSLPNPHALPRPSLDSPRILLFSGSVEPPARPSEGRFLSSMLDFGGAEREWLDRRLPSVLFLRPDVIFIEKSISKGAFDALRGAGVGVVTGVELPVLERIARCTRATVLPALDVVEGRFLGTCAQLRVEEFGIVIDEHEKAEQPVEDLGIELQAPGTRKAQPPAPRAPPKSDSLSDLFGDMTIRQPQPQPPVAAASRPKDFDPFSDMFGQPSPPASSAASSALPTAMSPPNFSSILGSSFYNVGGPTGGAPVSDTSPARKSSLGGMFSALTGNTPPKGAGFGALTSHRQLKPTPTPVTFLFLRGCPPSLHATLVLRGTQSLRTLHRLHRVLHQSLHVAYNLQLETSLMFDTGITYPPSTATLDLQAAANLQQAHVAMHAVEEGAAAPQYVTLISSSPYVTLPPIPFIPSLLNYRCAFPLPLPSHLLAPPPSQQPSGAPGPTPQRPGSAGPLQHPPPQPAQQQHVPRDIFHTPSASFPAFDPRQLHLSSSPPPVCTGLLQSNLLVGSCWFTTSGQCRAPDLKQIDFYSASDRTLADFLFSNCFDVQLRCVNPACKKDIFRHVLAYTHNDGRLLITVKLMKPEQPQDGAATPAQQAGLPSPGPPSRSSSSPVTAAGGSGEPARAMSPQLPGSGTPSPPPHGSGYSPTSNYRALPSPPQLHGAKPSGPPNRGSLTATHSHTPQHAFSFSNANQQQQPQQQQQQQQQQALSLPSSPASHLASSPPAQTASTPSSNALVTWSRCKQCGSRVSPYTSLSPQSLSYSFGKYLDVTFNNHALLSTCPTCAHPLTSHVRYVAIGNVVACFEYEKAKPFAVVARPRVKYDRAEVMDARLFHLSTLAMLSKQVFDEFLLKVTDIEANPRASSFKDLLQQLHAKVKHEQELFLAFYKKHGLKVQLLAGMTKDTISTANPALVQSLVASGEDDPSTALFGEDSPGGTPGADDRREPRPPLDSFDIHRLHRKLVMSFMEWNKMLAELCSFIFPKGYDDAQDSAAPPLPTAQPAGQSPLLSRDEERSSSAGRGDLLQINTERNALRGLPSPNLSFPSFASKDPSVSPQPAAAAPRTPMTPSASFSREPLTPTMFASLHSNSGSGLGHSGPITAAPLSAGAGSPAASKPGQPSPTPPTLDATPFKSLLSDMFAKGKGVRRTFKPTVTVEDLIEHNPRLKDAVEDLIASPLQHGHFCLPACVGGISIPVYDDEPSSIIAYTLASVEHMALVNPAKLDEMRLVEQQQQQQQQAAAASAQQTVNGGGPNKPAQPKVNGGEINLFDDVLSPSSKGGDSVMLIDNYVSSGGSTVNLFDLSSFGATSAPAPTPASVMVAVPQHQPVTYKPSPFSLASPTANAPSLLAAAAAASGSAVDVNRARLLGAVGPRSSISSPTHGSTAPHPNSQWWSLERPEWAVEQAMTTGFSDKDRDAAQFSHKFDDQPHHLFHADSSTQFKVTVYYARHFHALRTYTCLGDYDFLQSLARSEKWASTGGKSGSTFSKTSDDRYVLKYVKRTELNMFLDIAAAYFTHMAKVCFHHLPSVLVKILGVYTISWSKSNRDKLSALDVIVMPNLFYQKTNVKVFDLKGSERNRYIKQQPPASTPTTPALPTSNSSSSLSTPSAQPTAPPASPAAAEESGRTLLDLNLWEYTRGLPIPVHESSHALLRMCLHNDSFFLSNLSIIDYSLLLGFDHANAEVLVGVIDYIRQYTWDKRMETGIKSMGRIAGQAVPTVIDPAAYKLRFRAAMERYFQQVPDQASLYRLAQEKAEEEDSGAQTVAIRDEADSRRGPGGPGGAAGGSGGGAGGGGAGGVGGGGGPLGPGRMGPQGPAHGGAERRPPPGQMGGAMMSPGPYQALAPAPAHPPAMAASAAHPKPAAPSKFRWGAS